MSSDSIRKGYDTLHCMDSSEISEAIVHAKFELEAMLGSDDRDKQFLAHVGLLGLWRFIAESRAFNPKDRFSAACMVIGKEPFFCSNRFELPKKPGCYCAMTDRNILYIGESINIKSRVAARFINATEYGFILCDAEDLKEHEMDLIGCLRPINNHPVAVTDDSYYS